MTHKTGDDMIDMRTNNRYANNGVKQWMRDWEVTGYRGPTVHYFVDVPMSLFMFDELKALQVSLELAKQLSALFEI